MDSPKYTKFNISKVAYKIFSHQDIDLFVHVPKNLLPRKYPVLATFHGGLYVTGDALYPDWFAQWVLDFAAANSAIIVSPNYRLMPESNASEMLEDVSDFWTWIQQDFQPHLGKVQPRLDADLNRIIVHGASAGGTLAIQSVFTQPTGLIKAVIAAYPGLEIVRKYDRPILGIPTIPKSVLEEYLKSMIPGRIVTSAMPPERLPIALSINQQHRKAEFFGTDERLYPFKVLEKLEKAPPFLLVIHGEDDSVIPVAESMKFSVMLKKKFGDDIVDLLMRPGEHGFDEKSSVDEEWLKEGLRRVAHLWLGSSVE